jgi:hypothetical protein
MDLQLDTSQEFCYLTGSIVFDKKLCYQEDPIPDKVKDLYSYSQEFREMVIYLYEILSPEYELPSDRMTCKEKGKRNATDAILT